MRFSKKENLCLKENNLYLQPQNFQYMRANFIRNILLVVISISVSLTSKGQDASRVYIEPMGWSVGTSFGISDMWGNVGTQSVIAHYSNSKAFNKPCFIGGMFTRYTIHPCLAIRMQLNIGALYSTDEWNLDLAKKATSQGDDAFQRYIRKQDALDYLAEVLTLVEFTPFRTNPESRMAHRHGQLYMGAGIGGFYFEPYSTVGTSNTFVKTYNLHLEGQGWGPGYPASYSRFQPCVPLAVGYRWDLGMHFNLGIEYMWRMTFFGYLDGVSNSYIDPSSFASHLSAHDAQIALQMYDKTHLYNLGPPNVPGSQRGVASVNDSYSTVSLSLYYKVNNRRREWWHYHKNR